MNNLPHLFLSLDWGTSFFRLRLVDSLSLQSVAEESSSEGVATVFKLWQHSKTERLSFYMNAVKKHLKSLEQKSPLPLERLPLVVSGMASSTLGMMEVAYKEAPFLLDGSDLRVQKIDASGIFPHDMYLISGVKTGNDVMRGEETQVVGSMVGEVEEQVVVLPGTHSKHVTVKAGKALSFRTYMTGEFFELVSQKSILSASVARGEDLLNEATLQSFEIGVTDGAGLNLLHACFRVRTNNLFGKMNKEQNYHYLSGLLIGTEIKDLVKHTVPSVTLVSNKRLAPLYTTAFRLLLPGKEFKMVDSTDAVIRGQYRIFARQKAFE